MNRSKEEIKKLCYLCMRFGSRFEKEVANTVMSNDYNATTKQLYFLCSGASFKGGVHDSPQYGDNDYDRDCY